MPYSITSTDYGYFLSFSGSISEEEMKDWLADSRGELPSEKEPFGVLVDMLDLEPLDEAARAVLIRGQHLYKQKGMVRSAVLVNLAPGQAQLERIANQSGIYPTERYVNAHDFDDPKSIALDWVQHGKEPSLQ